jgi:hypothetical protein
MTFSNNDSAATQRDQALSILDKNRSILSQLFKECYLSEGRGALLVYAENVIESGFPTKHEYRGKEELSEIFDDLESRSQLEKLIDTYNQKSEGILILITSSANATYFVTVKLV